jgi:RNA polymerase sigma factor (sigma-70 family)
MTELRTNKAMANKPLNGVMQHVRKLAAIQAAREAADQQLLQQFVRSSDEAALTVLIERYAPMVLGVCRRALGCVHDAEDACQATFLVFSRKAATIRKRTALGSWLHAVALRVTANLKRERVRRERRERNSRDRVCGNPADEVSWAEVQAALDEELGRLPERFRAVLILCYLEGKTRDEAAEQLELSAGTLHGLLERGRKLLADRLTRRGVTLSAGLFGMALSESIAPASLSATQVLATAHASSLFALGKPVGEAVSATVLQLSQQVLKGMIMTKLKILSASVICTALLVSTVGFTFAQSATFKDYAVTAGEGLRIQVPALGLNDSDEAFIKRVSKDLRGIEPTPAEIHFFVNSKDAKRREVLVDLFIKERAAKKNAVNNQDVEIVWGNLYRIYDDARLQDQAKKALAGEAALKAKRQTDADAAAKAAAKKAELELLKAKVEVAKATVRQKEILLLTARDAKAKDLRLLEADLQRARAELDQAIATLTAAEARSK